MKAAGTFAEGKALAERIGDPRMLARLLTSMKDDNGRVLVDHFYDGVAPLSETEKRAIAEAPVPDADLMKELWLGSTETSPKKLIELLQQPSLKAWKGQAANVAAAQAALIHRAHMNGLAATGKYSAALEKKAA